VPIEHEKIDGTDERSGTGLRVTCRVDDAETNAIVDLFRDGEPHAPSRCASTAATAAAGHARIFFGDVTDAAFGDGQCALNVEPKHGALTRTVLRQLYQAPCNNMLYDATAA
jgi:hypothetical protein